MTRTIPRLGHECFRAARLGVGRAVSWVAGGAPNRFIRIFFGLELGGAIAAGVVLFR